MNEKPRRTIGLILLVISGTLLTGEILIVLVPAISQIANKSLGDHFSSLLTIFLLGSVGLSFRQKKLEDSSAFISKVVILILFLIPLQNLHVALKAIEYGLLTSLPRVRNILIVVSLIFIIVPYIFGRKILIYQTKYTSSHPSVNPKLGLYIIGLVCAILPCTVAFLSVMMGLPIIKFYYFFALSYVAAAIWSVWWYYRHSKSVNE